MSKEERYLQNKSPEIIVEKSLGVASKILVIFPALAGRNYQLYFCGQFISLIGTWLQIVAQSWLVLVLTNSAFLIGLVAAIAALPTLLFSLFGGALVDRLSKRKILLFTQSASMILAFILGFLTVFKLINVSEIIFLAFLSGTVMAIDAPARQAFVIKMVGKKDLASAIALNSGIFNSARIIGPSLAGFLIASVGTGGAFIVNGISYIAVLIALFFIRVREVPAKDQQHPIEAIRRGVLYAYKHPIIRNLLLFTGIVSVFGWSYGVILPYVVQNTFHIGAAGLGYFYAASGLGALVSTFLVSAYSKKINNLVFILGGNSIFALSMVVFTITDNFVFALPFLFLAGLGLLSQFSTINTTIQHLVEDKYRGRVMSLYTIMFFGMAPLGNFQIGFFSEHFGPAFAIRLGAAITFFFGVFILLYRGRIKKAFVIYQDKNHQW
ncbi:MFS transporter [Candidatus Curtissbacteria bacterium RIFCSPHIGHO2_01_FULL_41_44]|uniref:MFS transporter n=1 Tax=Candidatus Curtissbacteria bacterium RIFCSPLOWO2_01_FULL_42_50 TaxID=1797730 RepID=A0A1F5H2F4_9BACT|nr:MAG: MFS transporter [Candidatus Curtissbacteria bacterium RIFCSPHIGHO2_01_FULL_41_44]OGD92860.1 MAG: MFS transporter [Candidatus Curtissbacteria bacterium RIFCSPHIGHO2_02_FULL_42_58]OGD96577.1 MAG: MFS transporter [Candidatus Curtissbacteria bacterium RIFCSPHIGHO2_12_FULL_42_33]OGD98278.1 MAG: MFS transporter [Candidatus Curtissbacteria bacterium RIFCSPLOWO2_01_FULL_42_50]OGE03459.1 MAG: MFS transporter [Candidatus Curtissbacteria bacterium RIFCSPLOWO2_12_FULL_41_16]OGE10350.1 MAG: MFS tra